MKKSNHKIIAMAMALVFAVTALNPMMVQAASKKAELNSTVIPLNITCENKNPTYTLKILNVSKKKAKKAKWSSSNKKVATVKKGKITAKKKGTAKITCKVNGQKLSAEVIVRDETKPRLNAKSLTGLYITDKCKHPTYQLILYNVTKEEAKKAKWSSSDKKIMTVNKKGKIKAKKVGNATITCKIKGYKLTCDVPVYKEADKCNHKWIDTWEHETYDYWLYEDGFDYYTICDCGVCCKTYEEYVWHASKIWIPIKKRTSLHDKKDEMGRHGSKAVYNITEDPETGYCHYDTKYITKSYCPKCNHTVVA